MSMWMTFAPGANASSLPVTRSSKRAPTVISRSERCSAQLANFEPCMPGICSESGCESGNAPFAISVVTTGICVSSASACSSASAPALMMPPPT